MTKENKNLSNTHMYALKSDISFYFYTLIHNHITINKREKKQDICFSGKNQDLDSNLYNMKKLKKS
jgi:hypothetical protein